MSKILEEALTLDNLGHLALWLVVMAIVDLPLWISGGSFEFALTALPGGIAATLYLFLREKAQIASEHYDHDFRRGWPWERKPDGRLWWRLHKWSEFAWPSAGGWAIKLTLIGSI